MNFQTIPSISISRGKRTLKDTLRKSCSVMVDGKRYGPTNYQISVWEYESGCPLDAEDPLKKRKSFLAKTYNYFSKNLMSLF